MEPWQYIWCLIYASQYMPHNICLTAKTICAIDLSNNISHISILIRIECFIKENEVKCKKAFIKVHTDKYPIIMLILWFFVGSPFVCWNNSFPQLLQQQIKATRGGTCSNCTRSAHFFCIVAQKGLRHANCTKALCKTLMVQDMSKIAKEISRDIGF